MMLFSVYMRICLCLCVLRYICVVHARCTITPNALGQLDIPQGWTGINDRAFYQCDDLKVISMPDTITNIGQYAFYDCKNLEAVAVGKALLRIKKGAFMGCEKLSTFIVPDSVTVIEDWVFAYSALQTFILPPSANVSRQAFVGCTNLEKTTVPYRVSISEINGYRALVCAFGYGDIYYSGSIYKRCVMCPKGKYSNRFSLYQCVPCEKGTYASTNGTAVCTPCGPGTYATVQGATSEKSCEKCPKGRYSPLSGSEGCIDCPPGSFCNETGLSLYKECTVGRYTDVKTRWNCTACPAGRYQMNRGSAKCLSCPAGKFLEGEGAISDARCLACLPGSYSDRDGLPECSPCPTGQVQPNQGQVSCKECTLEGKIKTNNEARTLCIDNDALKSSSVMESMFTKGIGLSLSFGMAVLFVGLAGAIHFMKSGYSATVEERCRLGTLGPPQVVLKSALPGFSFGSEVVLIIGMMTDGPKFAWALLASRLLHPCTLVALTFAMTASNSAPAVVQRMMRKSSLSKEFSRRKVPLLCVLYLASVCDVTMLQLMPWVDSKFYTESMGYPSLHLMLVCMVVKTLQSLVSVVCQGMFLWYNSDINDPLMSWQAKILFAFSITLSGVSLVMGVMTLLAKWSLLRDLNEEDNQGGGEGEGVLCAPRVNMHPPKGLSDARIAQWASFPRQFEDPARQGKGEDQTKSTSHPSVSADMPAIEDLYGNNITGQKERVRTSVHNPMFAAAMESEWRRTRRTPR